MAADKNRPDRPRGPKHVGTGRITEDTPEQDYRDQQRENDQDERAMRRLLGEPDED